MEFKNINEALKYITSRAKTYPREVDYYLSEEYKQVYPELCRVNRLFQAARNVQHKGGSTSLH